MKIFIAGAKSQKNLDAAVIQRIQTIMEKGYDILVGDCYGVDTAVQTFLKATNYTNVFVYASNGKARNNVGNWVVKNIPVPLSATGFDFYKQKDIAMANEADYGFMIWDGKSKGTYNNMINLLSQNKTVLLFYVKEQKMIKMKSLSDLNDFVRSIDEHSTCSIRSPKKKIAAAVHLELTGTEQLNISL